MKLKYEFETTALDDRIIAVPVGDNALDFKGVLNLNSTAADILKLLKTETTEAELVSALAKNYDATAEELAAAVKDFVAQLRKEALLTE